MGRPAAALPPPEVDPPVGDATELPRPVVAAPTADVGAEPSQVPAALVRDPALSAGPPRSANEGAQADLAVPIAAPVVLALAAPGKQRRPSVERSVRFALTVEVLVPRPVVQVQAGRAAYRIAARAAARGP